LILPSLTICKIRARSSLITVPPCVIKRVPLARVESVQSQCLSSPVREIDLKVDFSHYLFRIISQKIAFVNTHFEKIDNLINFLLRFCLDP
jgi:hypothetical protein